MIDDSCLTASVVSEYWVPEFHTSQQEKTISAGDNRMMAEISDVFEDHLVPEASCGFKLDTPSLAWQYPDINRFFKILNYHLNQDPEIGFWILVFDMSGFKERLKKEY